MTQANEKPEQGATDEPERSSGAMREVCGDTVAIILATETSTTPVEVRFDDLGKEAVVCGPLPGHPPIARPLQMYEGQPLLAHAVKQVCKAQVAIVYVLTDPSIASDVAHAAHSVRRRKNDPIVETLAVERWALEDRTNEMGGFGLLGIPFALLEIGRALTEDGMGGFGSVLFMPADLARVEAHHIYDLCAELAVKRPPDVVTSLVEGVRRPPFLFSTAFLNGLEESGIMSRESAANDAAAPVVRDHSFGIELLGASPA